MIKELHIFDFDGTLVDSSHRYRTIVDENDVERIDLDYWIENEDKTLEDKPLPLADKFRQLREEKHSYPVVATARIWCELSRIFVKNHDLESHVISRKNREDCRGGADLKVQGIKRLLNLKQFRNVERIVVYEDNIKYLKYMMELLGAEGVYVPSNQGH